MTQVKSNEFKEEILELFGSTEDILFADGHDDESSDLNQTCGKLFIHETKLSMVS